MLNFLKPYLAPILAPLIGSLLALFVSKTGIVLDGDTKAQITERAIAAILTLFGLAGALSGVVKVTLNKKLNKANAATVELVEQGNAEGSALAGK